MCISDTHNRQREPSSTYKHADLHDLPDGDVLIHTGDFTNKGTPQEITDFATWISKQSKYKHCIVIAGNHDIGLAPSGDLNENKSRVPVDDPEAVRKAKETLMQSCTYLEDSAVNLYGYKVYGSPYSPEFGHGWAFNGVRGEHLKSIWCQPSASDPARVGRETNWAEKAATAGRSLTAGNGRPRQPS